MYGKKSMRAPTRRKNFKLSRDGAFIPYDAYMQIAQQPHGMLCTQPTTYGTHTYTHTDVSHHTDLTILQLGLKLNVISRKAIPFNVKHGDEVHHLVLTLIFSIGGPFASVHEFCMNSNAPNPHRTHIRTRTHIWNGQL